MTDQDKNDFKRHLKALLKHYNARISFTHDDNDDENYITVRMGDTKELIIKTEDWLEHTDIED